MGHDDTAAAEVQQRPQHRAERRRAVQLLPRDAVQDDRAGRYPGPWVHEGRQLTDDHAVGADAHRGQFDDPARAQAGRPDLQGGEFDA
ncbi:MAG: hypothetical protein QOI78_8142, partial [Actinomycetota bacterium]|nr:hypothetical protein [Actinomycetota bacterium]